MKFAFYFAAATLMWAVGGPALADEANTTCGEFAKMNAAAQATTIEALKVSARMHKRLLLFVDGASDKDNIELLLYRCSDGNGGWPELHLMDAMVG